MKVDLTGLHRFRRGIPFALQLAARRLAAQAVANWRTVVAVRTGQMMRSLRWRVWLAPLPRGAVVIDFYQSRSGFYYRFQRRAPAWTGHLQAYIQTHGPAFLRREVQFLLGTLPRAK